MDIKWQIELINARRARQEGNEGKARVCARRAAGAVAYDFLTRRGVPVWTASAYEALQALARLPGLDPDLQSAAAHLTLRLTEAFTLPVDVDLIAEAEFLINRLTAMSPSFDSPSSEIIFYGVSWCGDCRRARAFLDQHGIPYRYIDIDQDESAAKLVESLNHGNRSVPTILWPDGSILVEPTNEELAKKTGVASA
jgi:mycoredoxin